MSDYISRDVAMAFPLGYDHYDKEHGNEHFIYGVETYREWIESIPAAEVVEVVHGKWMDHVNPRNDDDWACSNCGSYFFFEAGDPIANGTKYCPNCGAKMDGGVGDATD